MAASGCELILKDVKEKARQNSILNDALSATSSGVAYSATAAGYLVDYTVIAVLGIVTATLLCPGIILPSQGGGKLLCLPIDALMSSRPSRQVKGENSDQSPTTSKPGKDDPAGDSPAEGDHKSPLPGVLGPAIYRTTASLREDSAILEVSRAYRESAQCLARRGERQDLESAYWQMKWLSDSPIYQKVSEEERRQINTQTFDIRGKLLALYPDFEDEMERKNRRIVTELLEKSTPYPDWQSPKDGSLWRLVKVGVPTAEVARIACTYLSDLKDEGKKVDWRVPQLNELKKAMEAGLFTKNTPWPRGDKVDQFFVATGVAPYKISQFLIRGNELTEVLQPSSVAPLLCVF